jgi:single-strand DNA-binding protein
MAWDINQVILVGRLTRDPELSYTKSNLAICKFSIANNRGGKDNNEEVNFFNITVWDKMANTCAQYLKKGSQTIVQGRLKQDRWQDENKQNRSSVNVVATNVQFLGSSQGNDGQTMSTGTPNTGSQNAPFNKPAFNNNFSNNASGSNQNPPANNPIDFENLDDQINPDDVPF